MNNNREYKRQQYKGFFYWIYHPKNHPVGMYEYCVEKIEDEGDGPEFNSYYETFNGMQFLSAKEARQCAKTLIDEYHSGEMKSYFDDDEESN